MRYKTVGHSGLRVSEPCLGTITFGNTVLPVDARNLAIAEAVREVAGQVGGTPAQVALAWVRQKGVIPILRARTVAQLNDNLGAADVTLSAEQVGRLDETSKIDLGYPHGFLARDNTRTFVYGGFWDRLDSPRKPRRARLREGRATRSAAPGGACRCAAASGDE